MNIWILRSLRLCFEFLPFFAILFVFAPLPLIFSDSPIYSPSHTYELISLIGDGDTSLVFLARDESEEIFAIKCFHPGVPIQKVEKEYQAAQILIHPNILKIYDFFWIEYNGDFRFFLVMECIHGKTLRTTQPKTQSCLQAIQNASSFLDVIIHAYNKKYVYQDFHTSNMMFDSMQNIKLIDLAGFEERGILNKKELKKYQANVLAIIHEILLRGKFTEDEFFHTKQIFEKKIIESI